MYQDRTMTCRDCSEEFTFTAGEQEFFAEKGFQNEPTRCKTCRDAKKRASRSADREFTTVPCADCGQDARVPFVPTTDRPIYCSDCFAKTRDSF